MDLPSFLLKALGVVLILLGIAGTAGGFYALKIVYEYDFEGVTPEKVSASISDMTMSLGENRKGVESSITNTSRNIREASEAVAAAGDEINRAAEEIEASSQSLTTAAEELSLASQLNRDAGVYLNDAADDLSAWAESYTFNGSPLPQKSTFQSAVDKIRVSSEKLESSAIKLDSASKKISETANHLTATSSKLNSSAKSLKTTGVVLNQSGTSLESMKYPLGGVINDVTSPIKELEDSITAISDVRENIKTVSYAVVGYLILFHLILLGIGLALIIIEINLFYPIT
jgi:DNA repair ATPase RecN